MPTPTSTSRTTAGTREPREGDRGLGHPEQERAGEHDRGQRAPSGKSREGDAADRDPHPVGTREEPGSRLRQAEHLVVERDRQGLVGPLEDRHAGHEQQERQCTGAAAQGDHALEGSPQLAGCVGEPRPDDRGVQPGGQERGDDPKQRADGQDGPGTEVVGHDPRHHEADEDGRAVHERRPPVGRHEVTGAAREQGQGREVRGPDGEDRDRRGCPPDEHDPQRGIQEQDDRGDAGADRDCQHASPSGHAPGVGGRGSPQGAGPGRWPAAAWRRRRSRRAVAPPCA